MPPIETFKYKTVAIALAVLPASLALAEPAASENASREAVLSTVNVTATAEETLKQAPGV